MDGNILLLLARLGDLESKESSRLVGLLRLSYGAFVPHDTVGVLIRDQDDDLVCDLREVPAVKSIDVSTQVYDTVCMVSRRTA